MPFGVSRFWPFGGFQAGNLDVAFWYHWETAVLGQILAGNLLEPDFGHLAASRPAIKSAFWNHWETAVSGPNPGIWMPSGSFLEPSRKLVAGPSKSLLGTFWESARGLVGAYLEELSGNLCGSLEALHLDDSGGLF